jgi:predicted PurR-regulated permease PerM
MKPDHSAPNPPEPPGSSAEANAEQRDVTTGARVGYRVATFTVFLIATVIALVYAISRIAHVLELFTLGLLIAMAVNPTVVWLEKKHVRRMVSVSALLAILAGGVVGTLAALGPTLVDQSTKFKDQAPQIVTRLQTYLHWLDKRFPDAHVTQVAQRIGEQAQKSLTGIQDTATVVFTASVTTVVESVFVLFIVVFLLSDPHPIVRGLRGVMPPHWQSEVGRIGELAVGKVQAWIQGTLILMLSIAVMDTVGLMFLGVPYALLWGVFGGLMEAIPTVGPIISAIPPAIVALTTLSPMTAVWVLVMYTVMQQIESNILVPVIMSNKVQLHPVTLLFFLLMMAQFLGIFGALIATPLAAVLKVLYLELYYRRLHGSLPPEEANDPVRQKIKRRRIRKAKADADAG